MAVMAAAHANGRTHIHRGALITSSIASVDTKTGVPSWCIFTLICTGTAFAKAKLIKKIYKVCFYFRFSSDCLNRLKNKLLAEYLKK